MNMNISASMGTGPSCHPPHRRHHHNHCGGGGGDINAPQAPDRNGFLDLLSSPFQALGLKGGNQNDKEYDKYLQANQAGNMLKGCC